MSNDFENSQEYREALEIAKKQEELYKNVTKAISPEALAKFQELSNKLSEWKNSLNNMPGLLKFAEMLKNYQQEVRVIEGLTEAEFEEKYRSEIEWSEKFGKNGWVISEHSNPADIKNWEQLLREGEAKVAGFFDGEDIVILDVIIEGLQEKYVSDEIQLYFKNGMQAFENEDYMTAAMYLLALLDNRVNKLVDFPNQHMSYKVKYSNKTTWTVTVFTEDGITYTQFKDGVKTELWRMSYKHKGDYEKITDFLNSFDKNSDLKFASSKSFWEDFLDGKISDEELRKLY